MRHTVLQLASTTPDVQTLLEDTYEVLAWPDDDGAREHLLGERGAEISTVVTSGGVGIPTELARRLPALKLVAINGVGYDQVDTEAMRSLGVRVSNTPDVLTADVADLAIALMINAMRRLPAAELHLRGGHWLRGSPGLTRTASGKRYGILGLGRIGLAIAQRLEGFGGTIGYWSRAPKEVRYAHHATPIELARWCDVLFVANAASAATRRMIDRTMLDALGPEGVLVNIARGTIIDEAALIEALTEGRILAAGLDVFEREPHVPDALLRLENVAIVPHVGSATVETRDAMGRLMLDNIAAHYDGRPLPSAVV